MGFTFGSTTPAPATGTAPAPAFGATAPAAPATGGFGGFGSTPAPAFGAPAPPAFGSTPAPAFGSTPAPAFGSTPAPAFGSTPAPAFGGTPAPAFGAPSPAGGFSFSSASGGSSLFSSTPAPAPFGSTAPAPFGTPAPAPFGTSFGATTAVQQPAPTIKGSTMYADLPPQYKAAIDAIYNNMMSHRRTMLQVQSCGPAVLQKATMGDGDKSQLQARVASLSKQLHGLSDDIAQMTALVSIEKEAASEDVSATYKFAKWPIEVLAARRGVRLSVTNDATTEEKKDSEPSALTGGEQKGRDFAAELHDLLNEATRYVDRVERMPSPYFWQLLDSFQQRIQDLQDRMSLAKLQLDNYRAMTSSDVIYTVSCVESQHQAIWTISDKVTKLQRQVQEIRDKYSRMELPGENVLDKVRQEELDRQQRIAERMQRSYLQSSQAPVPPPGAPTSGTPAPAPGAFSFSSAPAPSAFAAPATGAKSAFSFSNPTPALGAAPTPSLFASTQAPAITAAPVAGAPAPTFGSSAPTPSLFGSAATAPTPGLFGTAAAPAPTAGAPTTGLFGTPAPASTPSAPKKKSSSGRRGVGKR